MLTRAMPSVVKALSGVLPPTALKQLTQALGNCSQEVTQRGDVNVSPDAWTNINNYNGVYDGDTWNPRNYGDIINNVNNDVTNNNQNLFDFSTRQEFATNNFYGGDTINYAGDTYMDTVTTNNLVTNYITVNNPAGEQGPAGPPGADGRDGRDGNVVEVPVLPPVLPRFGVMPITYLSGAAPRINVKVKKSLYSVMVGATFDPETCAITEDKVDIELVTGVEAKLEGIVPQNVRVVTPPGINR